VNLTQVMLAEGAMRSAIVVAAGGSVQRALPPVADDAIVIAADGGALEAERLGLRIDLLVGDLDSAPAQVVARLDADGVTIERYPEDKDASDLELAIEAALREGAEEVLVIGGDGGRLDHLFGAGLLLASERWEGVQLDAVLGAALLHVVRRERALTGEPGELISLYAMGGPATGVTTTGLRWQLDGDTLRAGSTRGLSNEFVGAAATVRVREGVVLAIRPGTESP
jgi:thiamine pyrophosphokinase